MLKASNDKMQIWVVGTNDFLLDKAPLLYSKYITSENYEGDSINDLNHIFSEYTAMYYIWKNNIKSLMIGFCHYRRQIPQNYILFRHGILYFYKYHPNWERIKKLSECEIPYVLYYSNEWNCPQFAIDDQVEFLKTLKYIPQNLLMNIINPKRVEDIKFIAKEIYFTTWDVFDELMQFCDAYIQFIANKYNIKTHQDWIDHVFNKFIKYYRSIENPTNFCFDSKNNYQNIFKEDGGYNDKCNCWRHYSFVLEHLVSMFILSRKDKFCTTLIDLV